MVTALYNAQPVTIYEEGDSYIIEFTTGAKLTSTDLDMPELTSLHTL
jgi:hypothetical protein